MCTPLLIEIKSADALLHRFINSTSAMWNRWILYSSILTAFISLSACGGGSSGGSGVVDQLTTPSDIFTYEPGEFRNKTTFQNYCATPDLASRERQGQIADENNFLRSWTHETYFWSEDVQDLNPFDYSDPVAYFNRLITDQVDSDGELLDQFHFSIDSDVFFNEIVTGVSVDYGIAWEFASLTPPRSAVVRYVEPGSPADLAGVERGFSLSTIARIGEDPVSFISSNNVDLLNAALFPEQGAASFEFGFSNSESITLRAEEITRSPVLLSDIITIPGTDTQGESTAGYLVFNDHAYRSEFELPQAIEQFADADVDDLILDLRYNGGGLLYIASQLSYMIGGDNTDGKAFSEMVVNDRLNNRDPSTGDLIRPEPFIERYLAIGPDATPQQIELRGNRLPTLNLNRVYVITSADTCSASEAIINGLVGADVEVVQIGTTTCGKPYGFYPTSNCGTTYFSIQFQNVNDKGFGDYAAGFTPGNFAVEQFSATTPATLPGCEAADDLIYALGDSRESSLAASIAYIQNGTCPAASSLAQTSAEQLSRQKGSLQPNAGSGEAISPPRRLLPGAIAEPGRH